MVLCAGSALVGPPERGWKQETAEGSLLRLKIDAV